jgi:hypothetical protein
VSGRRFTLPNGVGIELPSATDNNHEVELCIPKPNRRIIEMLKALEKRLPDDKNHDKVFIN